MNPQLKSALIRSAIALVLAVAWVVWYDGPSWVWGLLAFYVIFTFIIAFFITKKIEERQNRIHQMQNTFEDDE